MAEAALNVQEEEEDAGAIGAFFSPEGAMMLTMAVIIDMVDLGISAVPVVGPFLAIAVDIFAVFFFGLWLMVRGSRVRVSQRTAERAARAARWARRSRWLRPLLAILEFVPLVGALPLWTIIAYLELKHSQA